MSGWRFDRFTSIHNGPILKSATQSNVTFDLEITTPQVDPSDGDQQTIVIDVTAATP